MNDDVFLQLHRAELELFREAFALLRPAAPDRAAEIDRLLARAEKIAAPGLITIGVYGGAVQWTSGSPFPIRILDYDGDKDELPDTDDEGHPCSIWIEPPNTPPTLSA